MDNPTPEKQRGYWTYISIRLLVAIWIFSLLWHFLVLLFFSVIDLAVVERQERSQQFEISLIPSSAAADAVALRDAPTPPVVRKSARKKDAEEQQKKVVGVGEAVEETPEKPSPEPELEEGKADDEQRDPQPTESKLVLPWKKPSPQKSPTSEKEVTALITGSGKSAYGLRGREERKEALEQYGGNSSSENSVALGLKWLMRHQDRDGKWDAKHFQEHCGDKSCWGRGFDKHTRGITGLVYLAFLASGHTPKSGTKYSKRLARTQKYLLRLQDREGFFDVEDMYNHAIVLLAIVESYVQSRDLSLAPAIRKAVAACVESQQSGGGWTYKGLSGPSRSDSSITGWVVLALTSAKRAKFRVPSRIFERVWQHFRRMRQLNGQVRYADTGTNSHRTSHSLAAVRMLVGLLLGKKDLSMSQQLEILVEYPPRWEKRKTLDNCMYYWYHGTLAMFLKGGKYWRRWNAYMRDMLIHHQATSGDARGSWEPSTKWGSAGGRVYSTALNVLNLEIYYRYHPNFMKK